MAITLQRKLELAGALSKVQPQLQRLHLLPEPKKRHRLRNAILLGSAITVAAVVAAGALRRRCRSDDVVREEAQTGDWEQPEPEGEPDGIA